MPGNVELREFLQKYICSGYGMKSASTSVSFLVVADRGFGSDPVQGNTGPGLRGIK
jgi:hypothetical protein